MVQLGFYQIYLLDTSCLTRLDRKDRRNYDPPTFGGTERALIWDGLERLCDEGRLKIIQPIKDELNSLHPEGLQRLSVYRAHRLLMRRTAPTSCNFWRERQKLQEVGVAGATVVIEAWKSQVTDAEDVAQALHLSLDELFSFEEKLEVERRRYVV